MEKFRGTLVVEQIKGKRSPFCVGTLKSSIGDFKVTDKALDKFAPGSYAGEFLVNELKTITVPLRQGTFTYIQALIAESGFLIYEESQGHANGETTPQAEPHPLDLEEQGRADVQAAPPSKPAAGRESEAGSTIDSELLRHHGETIVSALDAQRRWNDGQRIFAFHDQDGEPHVVQTFDELNSYAPDQLLGLPAISEEPTDPSILETIELIAQRKFGHTVQTRNRDSLDFFEVHTAVVQEALLAAIMAGMYRNA